MTEHRTSTLSTDTATMPPATPIVRDAGTPLLKKIHAIRPMLADREQPEEARRDPGDLAD